MISAATPCIDGSLLPAVLPALLMSESESQSSAELAEIGQLQTTITDARQFQVQERT